MIETGSLRKYIMRLLNMSMYLEQLSLDVRYRPGRLHLVPDALSHLESIARLKDPDIAETLYTLLVEMSEESKAKLIEVSIGGCRWSTRRDQQSYSTTSKTPLPIQNDILYY